VRNAILGGARPQSSDLKVNTDSLDSLLTSSSKFLTRSHRARTSLKRYAASTSESTGNAVADVGAAALLKDSTGTTEADADAAPGTHGHGREGDSTEESDTSSTLGCSSPLITSMLWRLTCARGPPTRGVGLRERSAILNKMLA